MATFGGTPMQGFSDAELVPGKANAIRAWDIDTLGRMVGQFSQVWTPGTQIAKCLSKPNPFTLSNPFAKNRNLNPTFTVSYDLSDGELEAAKEALREIESQHPVPVPNCGCGFWAYTDASAWDHVDLEETVGGVIGVIAGWGNVLVGTKGIRAEKADVLAVTRPRNATLERRLRRNYPSLVVVEDIDDLLAEFPIDTGWEPTPENDPDFWTRQAI